MATNFDLSWWSYSRSQLLGLLDGYQSSLQSGYQFQQRSITYSFYTSRIGPAPDDFIDINPGETPTSSPLTSGEQTSVRAILEFVERVVNLQFSEVGAGDGMIRFGRVNTLNAGYATYPNPGSYGINILTDDPAYVDSYAGLQTLWHEFGHSMGLRHPGNYDGGILWPSENPYLPASLDTGLLSVMTYNDLQQFSTISYEPLDLATLLRVYGPSVRSEGIHYYLEPYGGLAGQALQRFESNDFTVAMDSSVFTAFGTRGHDVLDVSRFNTGQVATADLNLGIVVIEPNPGAVPLNSLAIWDYMDDSATVRSSISDFGSANSSVIRLFPSDGIYSFMVDQIVLTDQSDNILLGEYANMVNAGGADDFFSGFVGGATLDGGSGWDRWSIDVTSERFTAIQDRTGLHVSVGGARASQFSDIETIQIADAMFQVDAYDDPISAQAYRIYQAGLDRTPDMSGLGYWISDMKAGTALTTVASGFMASPEFQQKYGSDPSDEALVNLLYENVLGRPADQAGLEYWINDLQHGLSRAQLVASFSESAENIANTMDVLQHGVMYQVWMG